jgi:hypothetical protein
MIQIGYGDVGVFDNKRARSVWNIRGKIIFRGNCYLGHGVKINVTETGTLTFGNNVNITAESAIDCQREIRFGDNCLVSWESYLLMGTIIGSLIVKENLPMHLSRSLSASMFGLVVAVLFLKELRLRMIVWLRRVHF